jgi:protease IV
VLFTGPGGTQPYYKGLVDRLGVNVHVYRVGKYKSFVEPYTLTGQSAESRAANQALAGALWDDWQVHVRKARPQADFASILADPAAAADGKGLATLALSRKLVDKLADATAFGVRVAEISGGDGDKAPGNFKYSDLDAYVAANPPSNSGSSIGIVTIAGTIVDGSAPAGTAGGDSVSTLIHKAARDDSIKALVVRVDSPGGSALASEQIRLAMETVRKAKKPVIVSMANVAASGGYWVAMAGDKVFAEPATITGSIGVFGIFPTLETTLSRYGVTSDGVKTTPLSGQPDIVAGTTPETDRVFQAGVEDIYRKFLSLVSGARKLPVERVDEIAQGRVWAGGDARQLGLIDAFGSLDDAVAEAAKRAKIVADDVAKVWIEDEPDFLSGLISGFTARAGQAGSPDIMSQMVRRQQALLIASTRDSAQIITGPAVQIRCLACPATPATLRRTDGLTAFFNRIFS